MVILLVLKYGHDRPSYYGQVYTHVMHIHYGILLQSYFNPISNQIMQPIAKLMAKLRTVSVV
jgi:hypothetical protein